MTTTASEYTCAPYPRWLAYGEVAIVLLLAPWFVFPDPRLTPWLMPIPASLWCLRLIVSKRLTTRTPVDLPVLVMAMMLCASVVVTVDLRNSFPKIAGVYYGIIVFFALSNHVRRAFDIRVTLAALSIAGALIAVMTLLNTNWSAVKIPGLAYILAPIYRRIPDVALNLPRAESGFNPNQAGGTLALLLPLQVSLALHSWDHLSRRKIAIPVGLVLAGCSAITALALLLTQSRGALVAASLAIIVLLVLRKRNHRIARIITVLLVSVAAAIFLMNAYSSPPVEESAPVMVLSGRPEIWHRALRTIRDHPLTGIGFDNLDAIVHARYPTFILSEDSLIAHAHNLFLQVALDLGIPGLVAFLAVLLCTAYHLYRSYREIQTPFFRAAVLGIGLGLGAQMIFGLFDAIALGQKPGLLLWVYLAMAMVLGRATE